MATTVEAKQVFDGIAWRYDLTNRFISMGMDLYWRHRLSELCAQSHPQKILDVACGTGDQLLSLKKFIGPNTELVAIDLLEKMVARGKQKVQSNGHKLSWFLGDGIQLPFKEQSFDAITITFGLRNLPSIDGFLKECQRLLRPNGKVWVLEFSQPTQPWFRTIYYAYLKNVLPLIGKVLTGTRNSYDYLARTVENFPNQKKLSGEFKAAGFKKVTYLNLCQGVVAIHGGEKVYD